MTVVELLEETKTWLEKEVCEQFKFKKPPTTDEFDADEYEYELVKPQTFIMFPPNADKFPSITIQFGDGKRQTLKESGELNLRFLFATWNPGTHYLDGGNVPDVIIDNEGWRDVWNCIDWTLRKLSNASSLGPHIRIKHEDAITFGPMSEQDAIANYYPHWCGWISFTIQYGVNSTNTDYSELI